MFSTIRIFMAILQFFHIFNQFFINLNFIISTNSNMLPLWPFFKEYFNFQANNYKYAIFFKTRFNGIIIQWPNKILYLTQNKKWVHETFLHLFD